MSTATLARMVRDPRSGEIHLPNETVAVLSVIRNLYRTLLKIRWQAGGDCVVFPDDLEANHCIPSSEGHPQSSGSSDSLAPCITGGQDFSDGVF